MKELERLGWSEVCSMHFKTIQIAKWFLRPLWHSKDHYAVSSPRLQDAQSALLYLVFPALPINWEFRHTVSNASKCRCIGIDGIGIDVFTLASNKRTRQGEVLSMLDHAWSVLIRFVHCEFTLRTGWGNALYYMVSEIRQATVSPSRRMKARVTGRVALLKFTEFARTALMQLASISRHS